MAPSFSTPTRSLKSTTSLQGGLANPLDAKEAYTRTDITSKYFLYNHTVAYPESRYHSLGSQASGTASIARDITTSGARHRCISAVEATHLGQSTSTESHRSTVIVVSETTLLPTLRYSFKPVAVSTAVASNNPKP